MGMSLLKRNRTSTPDVPSRDRHPRGQAMIELAIVLPLMALLLVMAVDFGRVFFGWVGLHSAARIAADFAAQYPDADWADPDHPRVLEYIARIEADAAAINCDLDDPLPLPTFPDRDRCRR